MDTVAKLSIRERSELFQAAEAKHNPRIVAPILEKDFWVCWTLRRLFEVLKFRPQLIFKGGTSLSKVFNAIERFSEDVDLSLSRRDLGFADDRDPEQAGISKNEGRRRLEGLTDECKKAVRERLLPDLRADFASALGTSGWSVDIDVLDPQTVVFTYPKSTISGTLPYVKPAIRLEMGARSDDWPSVDAEIKPYAAADFPQMFPSPTCKVRTLAAERTYWEKATLLHAEFHRPGQSPAADRLSRHYYDLYRLCGQEIGIKALERRDLLERVVQHKQLFFASAWANYQTAKPGSFHLIPAKERLTALQKDYAEMQSMIFGEAPKWDDIVQELTRLESRINSN